MWSWSRNLLKSLADGNRCVSESTAPYVILLHKSPPGITTTTTSWGCSRGLLGLHYACCGLRTPLQNSFCSILASSVQLNRASYDKIALGTLATTTGRPENPDCELIAAHCRLDFTIKIISRDQKS